VAELGIPKKVINLTIRETLLFGDQRPRLILAFADDMDIVGNSTIANKEELFKLESAANEVGLRINEIKTKYMATIRTKQKEQNQTERHNGPIYNFERVHQFRYLGATITLTNVDNVAEWKSLQV